MKSIDMLDVIGEAKDVYVLAAKNMQPHQRRTMRRPLLIAAVIILILALVGCAASIILSLDLLKMGEKIIPSPENAETTEVRNFISLQGFAGSKNYQAGKEWYEFEQTYDPDGEIRRSVGNKGSGTSDEYIAYGCYTQEMTDKVDEICEKYGLKTLGMYFFEDDIQTHFDAIGIDGITVDNAAAEIDLQPGYFYTDGSFQISGRTTLTGADSPWMYTIEYQFRCVMKSSFDNVFLNIGNIESYEQWTYALADGTEVLLAINPDKALIIADKKEFFVTVNILNPQKGDIDHGGITMDRAALEAFADTFDFSFVPQQPDVEAAQRREEERLAAYLAEQESWQNSDRNPENQEDAAEYIEYLLENDPSAESLRYALYDVNGDGTYELLIGDNEASFGQIVQFADGKSDVITLGFMEGMYLCENGYVETTDPLRALDSVYMTWFTQYTSSDRKMMDCIIYAPEENPENPWYQSPTSMFRWSNFEPITEKEYNAIREKYVRIELELKPITEFGVG